MTMHTEAQPCLTQAGPAALSTQLPALLPWISIVILFAAAVALRHVLAANTDVSWLLTVAERVLDGQRLYVDVVETNPPMAVLVYMPGIVIARALGLPVEIVTDSLMFAAIFVSLAIVARILKHSSLPNADSWLLAPLAFAAFAILPMQAFGQREHIAVVELLPLLAVFAVRMKEEAPSTWMIVVSGCGAGLAVSFNPQFVAIVCAVVCLAIYLRSWKAVFAPESLIAAAIGLLYAAGVVAFYPEFFTVIGRRSGMCILPLACRSRRFWKSRHCRSGARRSWRRCS